MGRDSAAQSQVMDLAQSLDTKRMLESIDPLKLKHIAAEDESNQRRPRGRPMGSKDKKKRTLKRISPTKVDSLHWLILSFQRY